MPGGDEVESIEVDRSSFKRRGRASFKRTDFIRLSFSEWILLWMNALKQ